MVTPTLTDDVLIRVDCGLAHRFTSSVRHTSCMDPALLLADRLMTLLRESGASKMEAHAALQIAATVLPSVDDISFTHPPSESQSESGLRAE